MQKDTPKYEQLPNPTRAAKAPPRFKWLGFEMPILTGIVIFMVVYLVIDFAILMRRLVNGDPSKNTKGLEIFGLTEGYFGIPRVII